MKYALVNDQRQEAAPDLSGKCECCGSPTIAKCGKVKIWHWAHKGRRMCDDWWENETTWHREWKGHFPEKWQEVVHTAPNGEKHIADVKIEQGYVIEFQHSPINSEERKAREDFYKGMIWVVDGIERPKDKNKLIDMLRHSGLVNGKAEMRKIRGNFDECPWLQEWGSSNAPVFFDFGDDTLLGVMPKDIFDARYVVGIDRKALIASLHPTQGEKSFKALLLGWVSAILDSEPNKKTAIPSPQSSQPRWLNRHRFRF